MKCMKILYVATAVALTALAGCSKAESEGYAAREQKAFEVWMKANHPEVTTKLDNGMYIEWLRGNGSGSKPVAATSWIMLDYAGRDIDGNVISTRDPQVAAHEGTFTPVAHYTPHYALFNPALYYFSAGEYDAIGRMSVGDSVRIYMPGNLAYGTGSISFGNGYEGWEYSGRNPKNSAGVSLSGRTAVVDLALRGIISDPKARELNEVEMRAAQETMNLLVDTIPGFYFKYIEEDTASEIIKADSIVHISYECRFLDGKLMTTNREKAALEEWKEFGELYPGATYFVANSSSIVGSAINQMVKSERVRYNSKMRIVFISDFGYGASGLSSSAGSSTAKPNPVVYPYTPLVMDVDTMVEGYGEDKEEDKK